MKVGVMVQDLHASQLATNLIVSMNKLIETDHPESVVMFVDDTCAANCVRANFSIMQTVDVYSFRGAVIATDLYTARKLLTCPGPEKKYLYVWDLEWFRNQYPYKQLQQIYRNPELDIIVRSADHDKIFVDLWNRNTVGIANDANISELMKVIHER